MRSGAVHAGRAFRACRPDHSCHRRVRASRGTSPTPRLTDSRNFKPGTCSAAGLWPELGGQEKYLDIIGVNFYPHNQWFYNLKGFRRIRKFTPI